ncbi:MAG: dihydroorotate dehydrogenase-like protein [Calditrichaeota bacterium]|nr:dihydroorotate dehydrogenase-like protein [Calditrichota bacterium]
MDLTTTYMGLKLKNPLVLAASPISAEVDLVKKAEDSGAAAVVMYSLFEEQINHEIEEIDYFLSQGTERFAESLTYFPEPEEFANLHAEDYLKLITKLKESIDIPVIGSLNGVSVGGWMDYAKKIEEAGADALELNIYYIATDPELTAEKVENLYLEDLQTVKKAVKIPVAIKLGPYFSAFANLATNLDKNGADALVLFNRFYQPDIDLKNLEVFPNLKLSTSNELRLPLRWIAILYGRIKASLAASTGVHTPEDIIKCMMVGADIATMASVLLASGVEKVAELLQGVEQWMTENEYESVKQMKGSMSYQAISDPAAFERANYIKTLQSFR